MNKTNTTTQAQGKAGKAGKWTGTGFQPQSKKQPKKSITLLDILLGRK